MKSGWAGYEFQHDLMKTDGAVIYPYNATFDGAGVINVPYPDIRGYLRFGRKLKVVYLRHSVVGPEAQLLVVPHPATKVNPKPGTVFLHNQQARNKLYLISGLQCGSCRNVQGPPVFKTSLPAASIALGKKFWFGNSEVVTVRFQPNTRPNAAQGPILGGI